MKACAVDIFVELILERGEVTYEQILYELEHKSDVEVQGWDDVSRAVKIMNEGVSYGCSHKAEGLLEADDEAYMVRLTNKGRAFKMGML